MMINQQMLGYDMFGLAHGINTTVYILNWGLYLAFLEPVGMGLNVGFTTLYSFFEW
jgi:hypothetical protein